MRTFIFVTSWFLHICVFLFFRTNLTKFKIQQILSNNPVILLFLLLSLHILQHSLLSLLYFLCLVIHICSKSRIYMLINRWSPSLQLSFLLFLTSCNYVCQQLQTIHLFLFFRFLFLYHYRRILSWFRLLLIPLSPLHQTASSEHIRLSFVRTCLRLWFLKPSFSSHLTVDRVQHLFSFCLAGKTNRSITFFSFR